MMKWKKDTTKEIMMIWTKETDDGASQRCRAVTQRASEMELIRLRLTAIGPGRDGKVICTFYIILHVTCIDHSSANCHKTWQRWKSHMYMHVFFGWLGKLVMTAGDFDCDLNA